MLGRCCRGWMLDYCTYAVGDGAAHGGDHGDAAAVAPADHLFRYGLGGHEDTCDSEVSKVSCFRLTFLKWTELTSNIDLEHHVRICLGVVES